MGGMGRRGGRRAARGAGWRRRRLPSLARLRRTALMADAQSARAGPAVQFNGSLSAVPATASVAASLLSLLVLGPAWRIPCYGFSSRTLQRTSQCGAFSMARVVVRFQDHDSMSRCSILLWGLLLTTCDGCLHTSEPAATGHADPRGFKVVSGSAADEAELDSLVRFVEGLKNSGHDIYRVTRIEFTSPTKATVRFLWSGGFHGGRLIVARKNGAWTLTDEGYYL